MGIYNMTYRMFDIINDLSFMNLYMCQMFSPFNWCRANLRSETSWISNLVSNDLRSKWLHNTGLSFCELMIDTWSKIDIKSILSYWVYSIAEGG